MAYFEPAVIFAVFFFLNGSTWSAILTILSLTGEVSAQMVSR